VALDLESLHHQLKGEGFLHTYVGRDGPNAFYADHTHPTDTAHIILEGEMTVMQEYEARTFTVGECATCPQARSTLRAWVRVVAAI
jgi:hypothetical protein